MSWLSQEIHNLENDAACLLTALEADGKALFVKVEPILKSDLAALINDVLPIASNAFAQYAVNGTLTDAQRSAAVSQVASDAKAVGIAATASVFNAAVSIAELNAQALAGSASGASTSGSASTASSVNSSVSVSVAATSVNNNVPAAAGSTTSAPAPQ
jgi:hypothetical protein